MRRTAVACLSTLFAISVFAISSTVAFAATVRLSPSDTTVEVGDSVTVRITLTSDDQAVNAVSGVLHFPANSLELTSLSKSASIIGLWVQEPSFSNSQGTVRFEGVILNPGYTGIGGTVITAKFRALKENTAVLTLSEVQALANDGSGTDILTGSSGTSITIAKASPISAPATTPVPLKPVAQPPVETPQPSVAVEPVTPQPAVCADQQWQSIVAQWLANISIGFVGALLILLVLLGSITAYVRYRALKRDMRKELRTVDATMHKALLLLRDEVEGFVEALDKEKAKRKLTVLESRFVKQMKQNLADTEKVMKKTIHEAEDVLG
jgi:uncharacterized membrane protein YidH (DUF202 family)